MGRLMKYELRSTMKLFIPLWLAVLVLGLINRFTFFHSTRVTLPAGTAFANSRLVSWLIGIAMTLYVVAIIGVLVVALIFIIQRFYQGLLKDEGYLTFTLPVRTDSILWAKTFSAMILMAGSVIVCAVSLLLLLDGREVWLGITWGLQMLAEAWGTGNVVLAGVLLFVLILASAVPSVQYLYLAMSIGHLAQKHRVGASVLAYVGINIALNCITSLVGGPLFSRLMKYDLDFNWNPNAAAIIWIVFGIIMLVNVIQTAIFYFPTRYILNRHLNLE